MPITVPCPGCGLVYTVSDRAAGRTLCCRDCRRDFVIPGAQLAGADGLRNDLTVIGEPAPLPHELIPLSQVPEPQGELVYTPHRLPMPRHNHASAERAVAMMWWLILGFLAVDAVAALVETARAMNAPRPAETASLGFSAIWNTALLNVLILFAIEGPAVWLGVALTALLCRLPTPRYTFLRACGVAAVPAMVLIWSQAVQLDPVAIGALLLLSLPIVFFAIKYIFEWDASGTATGVVISGGLFISVDIATKLFVLAALVQSPQGEPRARRQLAQETVSPPASQKAETATSTTVADAPASVAPAGNATAQLAAVTSASASPPAIGLDLDAMRSKTEDNLRQIGQAALRYATPESVGAFPDQLETLIDRADLLPHCVTSPFNRPQHGGYVYWASRSPAMPQYVIVAYDGAELAKTGSTHVLFVNGDVQSLSREQLQSAHAMSELGVTEFNEDRSVLEKRRPATAAGSAVAPASPVAVAPRSAADATAAEAPALAAPAPDPALSLPGVAPYPRPDDLMPALAAPPAGPSPDSSSGPSADVASSFVSEFLSRKSDCVTLVKPVTLTNVRQELLSPLVPSTWLGTVVDNGNGHILLDRWDVLLNQRKGEALVTDAPSFSGSNYAVGPDGKWGACLSAPKIRIFSYPEGLQIRSIDLSNESGTPSLGGFVNGRKLLVWWDRQPVQAVELCDATAGKRGKPVVVEPFTHGLNNGIVSPDGRLLALTTSQGHSGTPEFYLYDLTRGAIAPKTQAITLLDNAVVDAPLGMAFSPDGSKIAALFSQDGAAVVICWQASTGRQIQRYELPVVARRTADGRGLDWVADGAAWLVLGNTLVDSQTGKVIVEIGAPPSTGQWVVDPNRFILTYEDQGQTQAAVVTLSASKMESFTKR